MKLIDKLPDGIRLPLKGATFITAVLAALAAVGALVVGVIWLLYHLWVLIGAKIILSVGGALVLVIFLAVVGDKVERGEL